MKPFDNSFITDYRSLTKDRKPDFGNILKILNKEKPSRNTLFEFFLHGELEMWFTDTPVYPDNAFDVEQMRIHAFKAAGYDYCTLPASNFHFPHESSNHGKQSMSVNECSMIWDRESFEKYDWKNPDDFDCRLDRFEIPEGMKILIQGPSGVLENVTFLIGYNNLCYMLVDDPQLVQDVFDAVGSSLLRYYELAVQHDCVGGIFSNDDWGFNTQTMLTIPDMRKYVFPWHKKIAEVAHNANKPVILHSCGYFADIVDDIVDDMKFDGRHSYEDKIISVEDAYDKYADKFAILGGLDLDFVCRSTPEEVYNRACGMLERSKEKGGYGLGSGNSIPNYVPRENYLAMVAAATAN